MFCMLMRKHCEGATIDSVSQVGMERVIHIDVRHRDEIGDTYLKRIIVEMTGRHSNIILIDPATNTVLDGIRHVTPAISSYRVVLPGSAYVPPPAQKKANPLEVTEPQFTAAMRDAGDEQRSGQHDDTPAKNDKLSDTVHKRLSDRFSGIGPLSANEIVFRSGVPASAPPDGADLGKLWLAFHAVMRDMSAHRYRPSIVRDANGKTVFSVLELTHVRGVTRHFGSVSELLDAYYGEKAERDLVKQRTADLIRLLQNEKNKNVKKLEKLNETLEEAKEAERFRIAGELLTSSLHLVKKGDREIEVVNYYDEQLRPLKIELDPQLTPAENAQRYFKKYAKLKNSVAAVGEQMRAAREEIAYLDTLLAQLEQASLSDIEDIRDELAEQGYIRGGSDRKKGGAKKADKPALTCYTSSEGFPIFVGKNNRQNEYLTNRLAMPNDTWLHTKNIPGSHVVIRGTGFGETTLHEAAMLAAYYSQAKSSSQVPVDYTLIRHVRKPNGAKPGFVIYERQKTLYVTPDEEIVKAMPMSVK
jgi:predicted ribosome quality control (RQC) complex YloA/Tae2 family protein